MEVQEGQRKGEHRVRRGKSGSGACNLAVRHSNSRNPRKKIPFFSLQDPKSWINPQQDNCALQTPLWLYRDLHLWELSKPASFHVVLSDWGQSRVLWKWHRPISCHSRGTLASASSMHLTYNYNSYMSHVEATDPLMYLDLLLTIA